MAKLPGAVTVELATLVDSPPAGDDWLHEIKLDGYRIVALLESGGVRLVTRGGKDWTERMPALAAALAGLGGAQAVLDGEVVVLDERGVSDFQQLQNSLNAGSKTELVYYAFDLLFERGEDLRALPLVERKARLKKLLAKTKHAAVVRYSEHVLGSGQTFFEQAGKLGLEGIVSKRASSPYRAGRGHDWLEIKCGPRQGFTASASAASTFPLTHPDKVMYPSIGITKRRLLEYYELVAERMLPHVANRPLTLVRCPDGQGKPCFFQKHPGAAKVKGLRSIPIREKESKAPYTVIDDAQGLFALVQLGALEIHTWGSRADDFEHPDLLVFDLDPDTDLPFEAVIRCAQRLRELFAGAKLESFVKTTGGKGLHVCIPFQPEPELGWDEIKTFTEHVALALALESPRDYVATVSKAKRKGKIFIDYLRNGRGATFIAPYSTRAREGAAIAAPLEWDELDAKLSPSGFTVENMAARLKKLREDPFARMVRVRQRLRPSGVGVD